MGRISAVGIIVLHLGFCLSAPAWGWSFRIVLREGAELVHETIDQLERTARLLGRDQLRQFKRFRTDMLSSLVVVNDLATESAKIAARDGDSLSTEQLEAIVEYQTDLTEVYLWMIGPKGEEPRRADQARAATKAALEKIKGIRFPDGVGHQLSVAFSQTNLFVEDTRDLYDFAAEGMFNSIAKVQAFDPYDLEQSLEFFNDAWQFEIEKVFLDEVVGFTASQISKFERFSEYYDQALAEKDRAESIDFEHWSQLIVPLKYQIRNAFRRDAELPEVPTPFVLDEGFVSEALH